MPRFPNGLPPDPTSCGAIPSGSPNEDDHGISKAGEPLRLIVFSLDGAWYGLEIPQVTGIEPETVITPVPGAPQWLAGLFNLHGAILPAVDPRPLLETPPRRKRGGGLLVVFRWDGHQAALMVDSVDEMYELPRTALEPPSAAAAGRAALLLQGQVRIRDRLIGVLDMQALLKLLLKG